MARPIKPEVEKAVEIKEGSRWTAKPGGFKDNDRFRQVKVTRVAEGLVDAKLFRYRRPISKPSVVSEPTVEERLAAAERYIAELRKFIGFDVVATKSEDVTDRG